MVVFEDALIQKVWDKAYIVPGLDPAVFRQDKCGALIKRDMYGRTKNCSTGWEINHIKPLKQGGTHELKNLQALQWENSRNKSNNEHIWACRVTYSLGENTYLVQQ
jgi:5-methylcytosine-specific restriction endonuclease McrA